LHLPGVGSAVGREEVCRCVAGRKREPLVSNRGDLVVEATPWMDLR
jgi:hypothetical protein